MRITTLLAAILLAVSTQQAAAQTQEHGFYLGGYALAGNVPGGYNLGYSYSLTPEWGVRAEMGGGNTLSGDVNAEGVTAKASLSGNRSGLFVDWFPRAGGFRITGGMTINDLKLNMSAYGNGTINNKYVNLNGESLDVTLYIPNSTPYVGVGFGHHSKQRKGLGLYADIGVMLGTVTADVNTSLVGKYGITQNDVDTQVRTIRENLNMYNVIPSISLGVSYQF